MGTQPLRQGGRGQDTIAPSTKARGDAAEGQALRWLQARGLRLLHRNYRTPGRGGGEIDLIMQAADGTVVFVEVRQRSRNDFGGAAASITAVKRQRIIRAAHHYLLRWRNLPPTRFDVVTLDAGALQWLQAAFTAD
ncbi:MAG: YraN family protein [Limnohabitans sp.]